MGLDDFVKEAEQAVDGQSSADQVAANQATGKGHDAMEDTMVDSGRSSLRVVSISLLRSRFMHYPNRNLQLADKQDPHLSLQVTMKANSSPRN